MWKDRHRSFAITSVLRLGRNISLTNEKIDDVGGRMFLLHSNPPTRTEGHVPSSGDSAVAPRVVATSVKITTILSHLLF